MMNIAVGLRQFAALAGLPLLVGAPGYWLLTTRSGLEGFAAGVLTLAMVGLSLVAIHQTGKATRLLEAQDDAERDSRLGSA